MKLFGAIGCFILLTSKVYAHELWSLKNLNVTTLKKSEYVVPPSKNYLQISLNYEAVRPYFDLVNKYSYRPLKSRGEAHITILTPPEFDLIKNKISFDEINKLALSEKVQSMDFQPRCIGRGRINRAGVVKDTYYIVLKSEKIVQFRKKIFDLYLSRTQNPADALLMPEFYPHITLGFTDEDLHIADGVIKNEQSCLEVLHISDRPSNIKELPNIPNADIVYKTSEGVIARGNAPLNYSNLQSLKEQKYNILIFKNDKAQEVASELNALYDLGLSKDRAFQINFDWKDNVDFKGACEKVGQAIAFFNKSLARHENVFFHCTTGEDRTGMLASLYKLSLNSSADLKELIKNDLCDKGFAGGDKTKSPDAVKKINEGLRLTFLKLAFNYLRYKNYSEENCNNDPSKNGEFENFLKNYNFECGK